MAVATTSNGGRRKVQCWTCWRWNCHQNLPSQRRYTVIYNFKPWPNGLGSQHKRVAKRNASWTQVQNLPWLASPFGQLASSYTNQPEICWFLTENSLFELWLAQHCNCQGRSQPIGLWARAYEFYSIIIYYNIKNSAPRSLKERPYQADCVGLQLYHNLAYIC